MSAPSPATLEASRRPALKPEVQAAIDTAVERLVAEFQPEQIWLFGSYAWGEPRQDSDLDFVVVVPESDERPIKRMQRAAGCLAGLGMANDVVVKTREEFDRFCDVTASLTHKVTREGSLLYGTGQAMGKTTLRSSRHGMAASGTAAEQRSLSEPKRDWIRLWLDRSRSELRAVQIIARGEDAPLDTAIPHCHQAAKNSVEGYLAFADKPLQKFRDVEQAVRDAIAIESRFVAIMADATLVAPYAIKFRYPSANDPVQPDRTEFDDALAAAQRIYDFVLSQLPSETHPS
jgi:predicted nucleotidyltransferase